MHAEYGLGCFFLLMCLVLVLFFVNWLLVEKTSAAEGLLNQVFHQLPTPTNLMEDPAFEMYTTSRMIPYYVNEIPDFKRLPSHKAKNILKKSIPLAIKFMSFTSMSFLLLTRPFWNEMAAWLGNNVDQDEKRKDWLDNLKKELRNGYPQALSHEQVFTYVRPTETKRY